MIEYHTNQLDGIFGALSDSTRRSLVERLREGPATIGELAEPHDMSFQAVSKHLMKLEDAGLIRRRKDGRRVICELDLEPMRRATTWIDEQRQLWEARLDRLEHLFDELSEEGADDSVGKSPDAPPGDDTHQ